MSEAVRTILRADGVVPEEPDHQADAGFLWDFWYPAVRSSRIRGNRWLPRCCWRCRWFWGGLRRGGLLLCGILVRTGDSAFLWHFDGATVECSYHGWRFDACTARCVEIPSLTSQDKLKVERIFAGHYPCEERDGYVWVYMTSRDRKAVDNAPGTRLPETVPAAPGLPVFSKKYKITHLECELPSHVDQGIIG